MQVSSVVPEAFPERVAAGLEAGKDSSARGAAEMVANPGRLLPCERDFGAIGYLKHKVRRERGSEGLSGAQGIGNRPVPKVGRITKEPALQHTFEFDTHFRGAQQHARKIPKADVDRRKVEIKDVWRQDSGEHKFLGSHGEGPAPGDLERLIGDVAGMSFGQYRDDRLIGGNWDCLGPNEMSS